MKVFLFRRVLIEVGCHIPADIRVLVYDGDPLVNITAITGKENDIKSINMNCEKDPLYKI